jgi:hypothetical protein
MAKQEKQKESFLTDEQKSALLDELFEKNYVTKTVELVKDRLSVTIRNISTRAQLEAERPVDKNTTNAYAIHAYVTRLLSFLIVSYQKGDKEHTFGNDRVRVLEWLDELPAPLIDELSKQSRQFEKELAEALDIKLINRNFIPEVDQTPASKQSQEESISEKREVQRNSHYKSNRERRSV